MQQVGPSVGIAPVWAGIAIVVIAVGLLLSARTRVAGLVILGLLLLGAFFGLYSLRSAPPPTLVNIETYRGDAFVEHQQLAAAAQARAAAAQARAAAEIVKNQRMAARMADALVQTSPDGSMLETYPDGMQIHEHWGSRQRRVIRESDGHPSNQPPEPHQLKADLAIWFLGAPLAAVAVAFLVVRAKKGGGSAWPVAMVILVGAAVLFFFTAVRGTRQNVIIGREAEVASVPLPVHLDAAADGEFARAPGEGATQIEAANPPASIESLWEKLTKPRIELDPAQPVEVRVSQAELANAARIILSASAPVADPFTQGWLVNAAKAIIHAAPRAASGDGDAAPEHFISQPIHEKDSENTVQINENNQPRPDWVDHPPQRVGNTQQITVMSDPFTTAEECRGQLQQKLQSVVQTRLGELARDANSGQRVDVPELSWLGIHPDYITAELCPQGEYVETISTSVGPMQRVHTLVEFTPPQEQFLLDRWLHYARMESVEVVGVLSSLAIAGLALVYGLLKVDTWTRGYYTKRLFIGVPAAIIAVFFLSALFGA